MYPDFPSVPRKFGLSQLEITKQWDREGFWIGERESDFEAIFLKSLLFLKNNIYSLKKFQTCGQTYKKKLKNKTPPIKLTPIITLMTIFHAYKHIVKYVQFCMYGTI